MKRSDKSIAVRKRRYAHYILRMPIHNSIFEIEPFEVSDSSRFYFLGEAKESTELGDLGDIEFNKK